MSRKVIIDTNGLMIPGRFGIDIFAELEQLGFDMYLTTRASVSELEKIYSCAHGRDKKSAKIALSLVGKCTIIEKNGDADDLILNTAVDMNTAVLTNDAALKKRLCSKGITIIQLRERTRLNIF